MRVLDVKRKEQKDQVKYANSPDLLVVVSKRFGTVPTKERNMKIAVNDMKYVLKILYQNLYRNKGITRNSSAHSIRRNTHYLSVS